MKTSPGSPISVLIIEDVEEMRKLLEHVIQGIEGVKISGLAKNSFEARIELSRRRPDLIFLDEVLPGESSVDLLQELVLQGIPVILITGLKNPLQGQLGGAADRIVKPGWDSIENDRKRFREAIFHQFQ
jgi:response regulator of citrate/malate metabolism